MIIILLGITDLVAHELSSNHIPKDIITITDKHLATCIKDTLDKDYNVNRDIDIITITDITMLSNLECTNLNIKSLNGLEYATNLKQLNLTSNMITDISSISNLTNLTHLDLVDNQISDITPINALNDLKWPKSR